MIGIAKGGSSWRWPPFALFAVMPGFLIVAPKAPIPSTNSFACENRESRGRRPRLSFQRRRREITCHYYTCFNIFLLDVFPMTSLRYINDGNLYISGRCMICLSHHRLIFVKHTSFGSISVNRGEMFGNVTTIKKVPFGNGRLFGD